MNKVVEQQQQQQQLVQQQSRSNSINNKPADTSNNPDEQSEISAIMKSLMEDSAQFESEQAGAVGTTAAATGAQQVPDTYTTHFTHKFCILSFDQVWSLTQLYSVDFAQSRIGVKKVRSQKTYNQGLCQLLLTVSWDHRA